MKVPPWKRENWEPCHVHAYFSPKKSTKVIIDASPVGMAGMLMQGGKSDLLHKLSTHGNRAKNTHRLTEKCWQSSMEQNVSTFTFFGQRSSSSLTTSHSWEYGKAQSPQQQELNYGTSDSCCTKWDSFNPADYMSCHFLTQARRENAAEVYVNYVSKNTVLKAMMLDEVHEATQQGSQLQKVVSAIQTGRWHEANLSKLSYFKEELIVTHDVILHDLQLVIPVRLHKRVVDIPYQLHQGTVKTKQLIQEKAWFPGIDKKVKETVKFCIPCQTSYKVKANENVFVQPLSLKAHGLISQLTLLVCFQLVTSSW